MNSSDVGNGVTGAGVVGLRRKTSTWVEVFEQRHKFINHTPNYFYSHLALEQESVAALQVYLMAFGSANRRWESSC